MQRLDLFTSPVLLYDVPAPQQLNAALLDALVSESLIAPGVRVTNRGGWHSVPDLALRREPVFRAFCEMVVEYVRDAFTHLARSAGVESVPEYGVRLHAWAMVMRDSDYTVLHDHGHATLCGPYYLDTGDADLERHPTSGAITFTDPRRAASRVLGLDLWPGSVTLQPRTGQLALFPGYLQHHVHPYRGVRPRVCIASNAEIVPVAARCLPGGAKPLRFIGAGGAR